MSKKKPDAKIRIATLAAKLQREQEKVAALEADNTALREKYMDAIKDNAEVARINTDYLVELVDLRKRVEGLEELRQVIGDGGDLEEAAGLLRLATNEHGVNQTHGRDPYAVSGRLNEMSRIAWKIEQALAEKA